MCLNTHTLYINVCIYADSSHPLIANHSCCDTESARMLFCLRQLSDCEGWIQRACCGREHWQHWRGRERPQHSVTQAGGAAPVPLQLCLRIQKIHQFCCGMNHVAVAEGSYLLDEKYPLFPCFSSARSLNYL